jgi:hypothetical protein
MARPSPAEHQHLSVQSQNLAQYHDVTRNRLPSLVLAGYHRATTAPAPPPAMLAS